MEIPGGEHRALNGCSRASRGLRLQLIEKVGSRLEKGWIYLVSLRSALPSQRGTRAVAVTEEHGIARDGGPIGVMPE